MSKILAINPGINSSICVLENGEIVFALQEERLNRIKNWMGFPKLSLEYLLRNNIVSPKFIDRVVLTNSVYYPNISREEFYSKYETYFKEAKRINQSSIAKSKESIKSVIKGSGIMELFGSDSPQSDNDVASLVKLGFREELISRMDHHFCHAASAYFGLATKLEDTYLILNIDGGGDRGITSSVYTGESGELKLQDESSCYSLGNMYSATTHYLGFTPHEHEYKLMGLAPYVNEKYVTKYKDFFARHLQLKNSDTEFFNPEPLNHKTFLTKLLEELPGSRFDNIAAGLQAFTEEIAVKWVKGNLKKYGTAKVLCSGGVFMNVKLNLLLSELKEVDYLDVFPSCGDESNVFGGAFAHYNRDNNKVGMLSTYNLGPTPNSDLDSALVHYSSKVKFEKLDDINKEIAQCLSENKIVARCSGPLEFGARSLGNRSILANPNNLKNVTKINQAVKKRDFWMPFAPAMIAEKAEDLIAIPKCLSKQTSPYMMFGFRTKPNKANDIICGVHQADLTARAEIIDKKRYPDFHEIISNFDALSGIPCVLNTSFNLHGFPVVNTSREAIEVLLNSKIDVLFIEGTKIERI